MKLEDMQNGKTSQKTFEEYKASDGIGRGDVIRMLSEFGIAADACVAVHTSLRKIGHFQGGAIGLLNALIEQLCDGLLVIPTHTWATVRKDFPEFDVRKSEPCIGIFPQIASGESLQRKNATRSLHPTHSAAIFGKGAEAYAAGELQMHSRTPVNGVWGRLYKQDAKILLIGVGLESNTYLHALDEEINGVPDNLDADFDATVIDHDGVHHSVLKMHTTGYWVSRDFPMLEPYLVACGAIRYGNLGFAQVRCFDVRKGHDALIDLSKKAEDPKCLNSLIR